MDPAVDYDLARLCRCCRKRGTGLQSIFSYVGKSGATLHEMLLSCCTQSTTLVPDDGLPENLCARCIATVSAAYQFRQQFAESDAILREYVAARQVDGSEDNLLLGGMSVKVELVDIKAEQAMIEDNPLVGEEEEEQGEEEEEQEMPEPGEVLKINLGVKSEPWNDSDGGSDNVADDNVGYSSEEQQHYDEKPKVSVKKKRIRKKPDPSEYKECPMCGKKFDTKYHLDRHVKAHKNDTQCEHCEKRFLAMDFKELRKHMLAEHPGMAIRPHRKSKDDEGSNDEEKADGRKKRVKKRGANEYRECPICGKGFPSKYHLERHVKTHNNDTKCEFCNRQFSAMAYKEYCEHMQLEHPGMPVQPQKKPNPPENSLVEEFFKTIQQKEIVCKLCDVKLGRIAELRAHLRTHSDPVTLTDANIPNKPFLFAEGSVPENYVDQLVQQIIQWDVQRFYQIVEPDGEELGISDSDSEPEQLVQRVHTCFVCHQSFPRQKLLIEHATGHQPEELPRCQHCHQGFPNNTILERHLRQQCANSAKNFLCALCNTKFMWQASLDRHAAVHHSNPSADPQHDSGKRFLCPVCGKGFTQMHHLKRHVRGHMPAEKKFECPECHRKFHRKDNMKFHMRTHQPKREDEPPKQTHLCSLCGRGFTSNYNYVVHMRRHTGERPFKCDMCDKAFPRSLDLTYHKRTHTGDKPSVCSICGKAFSRHHRLVRHMRVHTGARPYACTYCDRTFTQSNDLTLHIRRHTGEKPYSCPICNERFIQGTALRTHQRATGHITEETLLPASNYGRSLLEG